MSSSSLVNDLAGKIQSLIDSRTFVDMIAETFADELPPAWSTRTILDRVAHAEYECPFWHAEID